MNDLKTPCVCIECIECRVNYAHTHTHNAHTRGTQWMVVRTDKSTVKTDKCVISRHINTHCNNINNAWWPFLIQTYPIQLELTNVLRLNIWIIIIIIAQQKFQCEYFDMLYGLVTNARRLYEYIWTRMARCNLLCAEISMYCTVLLFV